MSLKLENKCQLLAVMIAYIISLVSIETVYAANKEFVWYNGKRPITYSLPGSVSPVVAVALDMFKGDMQQVTGVLPQKTLSGTAVINIIQLDKNKSVL